MQSIELKLSTGKVVVWDGASGEDAARNYVADHSDATVVAWRNRCRHGCHAHDRAARPHEDRRASTGDGVLI